MFQKLRESQVFQKLRESRLYVKREKCSFAKERIKFLGHVIENGRIRMDLEKVRAESPHQCEKNFVPSSS